MSIVEAIRREALKLRLASLQARQGQTWPPTSEVGGIPSVIGILSGPGRSMLPQRPQTGEAGASTQPVTTGTLSTRDRPLLSLFEGGRAPIREAVASILTSLPSRQPQPGAEKEPTRPQSETPEQQERRRKAEELRRARESMAVEGIGC